MNYFSRKIKRIKELGIRNSAFCSIKKIYYRILRLWFGFDAWHARAPFECRPYKQVVVDLCNSVRSDVAVEIGCGLGEIISRVNAGKRIGLDTDPHAIGAATFLYGNENTLFKTGSSDSLGDITGKKVLVIAVNFHHGFTPDEAKLFFDHIMSSNFNFLVSDRTLLRQSGWYDHDLASMYPGTLRVAEKRHDVENVRELFLYEKIT
ncbi:MAG: hypothetical protein JWM20_828 [Patescibacteria group bacterium]|nr:hypothetical protein [Patescibacteria group bacterium]